jgi:hypothetical protein
VWGYTKHGDTHITVTSDPSPKLTSLTSLFLAPPLRATSCNVHYNGSILYDMKETWSKERLGASLMAILPRLFRNSLFATLFIFLSPIGN